MHIGSTAISHIFVQNYKKMQQQQILCPKTLQWTMGISENERQLCYARAVHPFASSNLKKFHKKSMQLQFTVSTLHSVGSGEPTVRMRNLFGRLPIQCESLCKMLGLSLLCAELTRRAARLAPQVC